MLGAAAPHGANAETLVIAGCTSSRTFSTSPTTETFGEFPPIQKPGPFTIGDAFKTIQAAPNP
jgi:hypothetical protein